jgi:hypothetical protein
MKLSAVVFERLPTYGLMLYVDVANAMAEVPWDVLDACRALVRAGRVREGFGDRRGTFGRRR